MAVEAQRLAPIQEAERRARRDAGGTVYARAFESERAGLVRVSTAEPHAIVD
jgi:hypothetical protein